MKTILLLSVIALVSSTVSVTLADGGRDAFAPVPAHGAYQAHTPKPSTAQKPPVKEVPPEPPVTPIDPMPYAWKPVDDEKARAIRSYILQLSSQQDFIDCTKGSEGGILALRPVGPEIQYVVLEAALRGPMFENVDSQGQPVIWVANKRSKSWPDVELAESYFVDTFIYTDASRSRLQQFALHQRNTKEGYSGQIQAPVKVPVISYERWYRCNAK